MSELVFKSISLRNKVFQKRIFEHKDPLCHTNKLFKANFKSDQMDDANVPQSPITNMEEFNLSLGLKA